MLGQNIMEGSGINRDQVFAGLQLQIAINRPK